MISAYINLRRGKTRPNYFIYKSKILVLKHIHLPRNKKSNQFKLPDYHDFIHTIWWPTPSNPKKALTENIGKYQTQYLIGFQNSLILKWVVATKGLSDNPTKPIRGAVAIETRSLPHQRPDIWWNHVNHTGERFFGGTDTKYLDQALCHALWNIIYFTKSIYRSTTWHNKVSDFPRHHKTPCIFQ